MISMSAKKKVGYEATRFGHLPATVSLSIREPGAALTHFAGLILFSIGAGALLDRTRLNGGTLKLIGMVIYVISTCLLYAASTTYHTIVTDQKKTTLFRKLDHISISVMIAGTYTPICLASLPRETGTPLLIGIWSLALVGILFKIFWITCPKWISSLIYIAMGWLCVFSLGTIIEMLPGPAFALLLAGGLFYTVGAVIYAMHPKKFDAKHIYFGSHEIFHVLIMFGTLCHFLVMYLFVA